MTKHQSLRAGPGLFGRGGRHMDRKKEQRRRLCRMPNGQPWYVNGMPVYEDGEAEDYEICNCDQALYLASLLRELMKHDLEHATEDYELIQEIKDALDLMDV